MDDYEKKKFVAKADNLTVGQLLDVWAEAVSYTHLLSAVSIMGEIGDFSAFSKPKQLFAYFGLDPVSYTHLDVYKRQVYNTCYTIRNLYTS